MQEFNFANTILWGMAEGYASEMSAKRTAMENATKNAGEMITKLSMVYNRGRQAVITNELSKSSSILASVALFLLLIIFFFLLQSTLSPAPRPCKRNIYRQHEKALFLCKNKIITTRFGTLDIFLTCHSRFILLNAQEQLLI